LFALLLLGSAGGLDKIGLHRPVARRGLRV